MNFAFCKLKRLRKEPYRKLISDKVLFDQIDLHGIDRVQFDVDHKLDDDSWFSIPKFSTKAFCLDILKGHISSVALEGLGDKGLDDIGWLVSVQDGDFYFQKVSVHNRLKRRAFYKLGDAVEFDPAMDRIIVNLVPDAIYAKNEDVLLFRNLASITTIFDGISDIAREATAEDVDYVLGLQLIQLEDGFVGDNISRPNLKRISVLIDRLKMYDADEHQKLQAYLVEYCSDIEICTETGRRKIANDGDLKKFLYALDERYHVTEITGRRRLANSVKGL